MAIDIEIIQKGIFKKKLNLQVILANLPSKYGYGLMSDAYVLKELKVEDYSDQYVVMYDKDCIGRGFNIKVEDHKVVVSQNLPCTKHDIREFYSSVRILTNLLKTDEFFQDVELKKVDEIEEITGNMIEYNTSLIKNIIAKEDAFIIFGAMFPVSTIAWLKEELKDSEISLYEKHLQARLHKLQTFDIYYANPLLVRTNQGNMIGFYAITEDVMSVLQANPFIVGAEVKEWFVILGAIKEDGGYQSLDKHIPYEDFKNAIDFNDLPNFDDDKKVYTLSKEIIDYFEKNDSY